MTEHEYFDNDFDNIDENPTEEEKNELVKKIYGEFTNNLTIVYNVVKALPDEIQLDALITMMREI